MLFDVPYSWVLLLPKTTNTHSQYVIPNAFALQKWLQERFSLLRHTHFARPFLLCYMKCKCHITPQYTVGRDGVVCIATRYRLEGPGIEFLWGEIFRTYPDRLRGPSTLLYSGYRVFPGGKDGGGVMPITYPLLVPKLRMSWAIPLLILWVLQGLLRGSLYLYHSMFCLFCIDVTVCRLMDRIRTACLRSEVVTALVVGGAVVCAVTVSKEVLVPPKRR